MQPRNLLTQRLAADYSCAAVRGRSSALLLLGLCAAFAAPATSRAGVIWKGASSGCEPLATFYSSSHQPGNAPCCSTQPGVCPGGTACPASGRCPGTATACVPGDSPNRPNVILTISDDQGSCHYGTAGECRSVQTGTPIPPPSTPTSICWLATGPSSRSPTTPPRGASRPSTACSPVATRRASTARGGT